MKKRQINIMLIGWVTILSICLLGSAWAMDHAIGTRGLKSAFLPPVEEPGMAYVMYNTYYTADMTDSDGDDVGVDLDIYAQAHRFIWKTGKKVLGGDFQPNIAIPILSISADMTDIGFGKDRSTGLMDIFFEPVLISYHFDKVDMAFGLGATLPTGDEELTGDHWSLIATWGITYYPDADKKWNISIIPGFEIHGEDLEEADYTEGHDFHWEWGIGYQVTPFTNIGIVGYDAWQVSDDDGATGLGVSYDAGDEEVHAVGFSVQHFSRFFGGMFEFICNFDYEAKNSAEGTKIVLNFAKSF